jgi:hypothetical protein
MSLPIVRTSERRDFMRCPQRWWWTWREGLRPMGPAAVPLWFGGLVHDALAGWYLPGSRRGPHPAETFAKLAGDEVRYMKMSNTIGDGMGSITEETLVNATELGIKMLDGYVATYGKDEHMRVIQPEQTFKVMVMSRKKAGRKLGYFAGTYDLVWEDLRDESYWLEEHKTAKAIITDHLGLDPQGGGYWMVAKHNLAQAGLIPKGKTLKGIEYNFLRKAVHDETKPRNALGHVTNKPQKAHYVAALQGRASQSPEQLLKLTLAQLEIEAEVHGLTVLGDVSKNQPRPLFVRHKIDRTAAENEMQLIRLTAEMEMMGLHRRGKIELLKNTSRDCQWDCNHYQMCLLHEQAGDWEYYKELAYEVRDPYADHRKTTEGDD